MRTNRWNNTITNVKGFPGFPGFRLWSLPFHVGSSFGLSNGTKNMKKNSRNPTSHSSPSNNTYNHNRISINNTLTCNRLFRFVLFCVWMRIPQVYITFVSSSSFLTTTLSTLSISHGRSCHCNYPVFLDRHCVKSQWKLQRKRKHNNNSHNTKHCKSKLGLEMTNSNYVYDDEDRYNRDYINTKYNIPNIRTKSIRQRRRRGDYEYTNEDEEYEDRFRYSSLNRYSSSTSRPVSSVAPSQIQMKRGWNGNNNMNMDTWTQNAFGNPNYNRNTRRRRDQNYENNNNNNDKYRREANRYNYFDTNDDNKIYNTYNRNIRLQPSKQRRRKGDYDYNERDEEYEDRFQYSSSSWTQLNPSNLKRSPSFSFSRNNNNWLCSNDFWSHSFFGSALNCNWI